MFFKNNRNGKQRVLLKSKNVLKLCQQPKKVVSDVKYKAALCSLLTLNLNNKNLKINKVDFYGLEKKKKSN